MNPMPPGSYTLRNLIEVPLPDPVSWWPQTIGWQVVALMVLIGVACFVRRQVQHWWRQRYRREAMDALTRLTPDDEQWPRHMMRIIKVVMVYLDPQNAPLYGQRLLRRMSDYQPAENVFEQNVLFIQWIGHLENPHSARPDFDALSEALKGWLSGHRIVERVP